MKEKISTIIMIIISLAIIGVIILFGVIIYQEFLTIDTNFAPEDFQTVFEDETPTANTNDISENIQTPEIVQNTENAFANINSASGNNTEIDYSNINVNKYFYDQLEEYSQIIYKALEANKENMKTGTYRVELGYVFSDLLAQDNGQEELGNYYQSAIEAFTYDNPEVFYLNANNMYLNMETIDGKRYNVYINNGNEANYLIDEFSSKEQIDSAINQIESVRNDIIQRVTGNVYNDIRMVHDYLIDNINYDTSLSKSNIYNVYGALVGRECVCEGYARAFKYILDGMDIPCVMVRGYATNSQGETENHAWNYVQYNNRWYAVDTTWDDPVIIGGGTASNETKYRYFMKTGTEFAQDHFPQGNFTTGGKTFVYPEI